MRCWRICLALVLVSFPGSSQIHAPSSRSSSAEWIHSVNPASVSQLAQTVTFYKCWKIKWVVPGAEQLPGSFIYLIFHALKWDSDKKSGFSDTLRRRVTLMICRHQLLVVVFLAQFSYWIYTFTVSMVLWD